MGGRFAELRAAIDADPARRARVDELTLALIEHSDDYQGLAEEVERLRAVAAAARAVVADDPTVSTWGGYSECAFCEAARHLDGPLTHEPDCPWAALRAALDP